MTSVGRQMFNPIVPSACSLKIDGESENEMTEEDNAETEFYKNSFSELPSLLRAHDRVRRNLIFLWEIHTLGSGRVNDNDRIA